MAAGAFIVLAINLCGAVGLVPGEHPEAHEQGTPEHAAMAHAGHHAPGHDAPATMTLAAASTDHEACPAHGCCSLLAKKESRSTGLGELALVTRTIALRTGDTWRAHEHRDDPDESPGGAAAPIPLRL